MMSIMKSRLFSRKNIIRFYLPLIHFIASFFYERLILIFDLDREIVAAVEKAQVMTSGAERVLGYIIARFFAALIIYLIWMLIYFIVDHIEKKRYVLMFTAFFLIGLLVLAFLWPDSFTRSNDNLITYSYGLRLFPEYWHSAYTSLIYLACLMVCPTPFSISILQWLMFVFCLGYLYKRLSENEKLKKGAKWTVFLIFFVPDTYILVSDPYRTELYALACMFYISLILMDILDGKKRNILDRIWLIGLSAFIAVWRTEGIILGFLGVLAILIFNSKLNKRAIAVHLLAFLILFVIISIPQKLGDKKYYGSDYSIINSFATLRNIFNRTDSNLTYAGADEDIAAIEAVVPVEAIRLYGMEGYRKYNVLNGHTDMNQSITDAETGKAYVKAFYSLVLHNPKAYVLTQLGMVKTALGISQSEYIEKISGPFELSRYYPDYTYNAWDIGQEDLLSAPYVMEWLGSSFRLNGYGIISRLHNVFYGFFKKIHIHTAILIAMVLFELYIVIRELVRGIRMRNFRDCGFGFVALTLLLQAAAITLVMPAGVLSYFRAFYCGTFVLDILYLVRYSSRPRKAPKSEDIWRSIA